MSTPETPAPTRKGHAARSAALKRLLETHKDEFDAILKEERSARGLFSSARVSVAEAMAENERLKKLLEEHGIQA